MHFEILIEDQSGKKMLEILLPKIIKGNHTFRIIHYKGIGKLPSLLGGIIDPRKRLLLNNLPRLLRGYGKTYCYQSSNLIAATVIIICDLDIRCFKEFKKELTEILNQCNPKPNTRFCLAIEEGEAWLMGDISAIKKAYPRAKDAPLKNYTNDSICGTWEKLADAIYKGGSRSLLRKGYIEKGIEKSKWAENISLFMDVNNNSSQSFCYFRDTLRRLMKDDCS